MKRIRERRDKLHMSQGDLAYLIGKNQKQMSQYERGVTQPTAATLKELALALGVSADWLLELTDIEDRPMRGIGDLDEDEKAMIEAYRKKDRRTQEQIREMIHKVF